MNFYPISFPGIVFLPSAVVPIKHIRAEDGKHKRRQGRTPSYELAHTHTHTHRERHKNYLKVQISEQACCLQTHRGVYELNAYTQETHIADKSPCRRTHAHNTHTSTPRGDEGQTGLIVSSSRSTEHIDFSHTPLSTQLPPLCSSLLLSKGRFIFFFLSSPLSLSLPRCPLLKPHFFFPNSSLSLSPPTLFPSFFSALPSALNRALTFMLGLLRT